MTVLQMMDKCGWKQADTNTPIPMIPMAWFYGGSRAMAGLHETFWSLRDKLMSLRD